MLPTVVDQTPSKADLLVAAGCIGEVSAHDGPASVTEQNGKLLVFSLPQRDSGRLAQFCVRLKKPLDVSRH